MKLDLHTTVRDACGLTVLWGLAGLLSGCGSLTTAGSLFKTEESRQERQIERHRSQVLESRDSADLRWLLREGVRSGMSRAEVAQVLGERGTPVDRDARFKRNGGHYREHDRLWKWGPDNQGQSVLLAFREGILVNFDPDEFNSTDAAADPLSGRQIGN